MSLNAGTVTVNPATGARTGSGLALELYDAEVNTDVDPDDPSSIGWVGYDAAAFKTLVIAGRTRLAANCTARAAAIVGHITAFAVVHVGSDSGTIE